MTLHMLYPLMVIPNMQTTRICMNSSQIFLLHSSGTFTIMVFVFILNGYLSNGQFRTSFNYVTIRKKIYAPILFENVGTIILKQI